MSYFKLGSLFKGITPVVTSGGTTTLTASSKQLNPFTGSSTQTVVLPDATTLSLSRRFDIYNRSTGIVTVQSSGGTVITTIPAGSQRFFISMSNSTAAGSWATGGVTGSGGGATVSTSDKFNLLAGMAGLNASTDNIEARPLNYNPDAVGGNYWLIKTPAINVTNFATSSTLNGFAYVFGGYDTVPNPQSTNTRFDETLNTWLTRAALTTATAGMCAATVSGLLFGYGGYTSAAVATSETYSDATNLWTNQATLVSTRYSAAYDALPSGNAIACGGVASNGNTTEVYFAANSAWLARAGFSYSTTSNAQKGNTYNGFFYINGGNNGSSFVTNVSKYREEQNTWQTTSSLPEERQDMRGCAGNGFNWMAGGTNNANFVSTTYRYSDATDQYTAAPSLSSARLSWNHSNVNGQNIVLGGGTYSPAAEVPIVEQYVSMSYVSLGVVKKTNVSPASILVGVLSQGLTSNVPVQIRTDGDNWKTMQAGVDSALKFGESYAAKFLETGDIYTAGGENPVGSAINTVERYVIGTNSWTTRQSLPAAVTNTSCFKLGGFGYVAVGTTNTLYNELSNVWTSKTGTSTSHNSGVGTFLNDFGYSYGSNFNQRYAATSDTWLVRTPETSTAFGPGGYNLSGYAWCVNGTSTGSYGNNINNNQQYSDVTNAWVAKTVSNAGRAYPGSHSTSGKGYIAGGYNAGSFSTQSTEKYNPATNSWSSSALLSTSRTGLGGCSVNGSGYTFGGQVSAGLSSGAEQLNPATDAITVLAAVTGGGRTSMSIGFTPGAYRTYEIRIGVPASYAGLGDGVWATRTSMPQIKGSSGSFQFGIYNYLSDGSGGTSQELMRYDSLVDVWTYSTPFPFSNQEAGASANLAVNGYAHRFGDGGAATHQTHYRFEPIAAVWISSGAYPNLIYQHAVFCLNGLVYGTGGYNGGLVTATNVYSDSTNVFTSKAAIPGTTQDAPGVPFNGFGYVMGGSASGTSGANYQYADASNSWLTKATNSSGLRLPSAFVASGQLTIAGGYSGAPVTIAQNYNDILNSWVLKSPMATATYGGMNGSANGSGYVMGGYNGSTNTALNYQYAPSIKNAILGMALEVK